uniref:Uncharacterized protein n=1 Tax=Oryza sativa subsp. japonica TaxID=39947 RepID=Q69PU4_ORYSJ|nr:hypothetical protein [Oryza sativa Japonica Group]
MASSLVAAGAGRSPWKTGASASARKLAGAKILRWWTIWAWRPGKVAAATAVVWRRLVGPLSPPATLDGKEEHGAVWRCRLPHSPTPFFPGPSRSSDGGGGREGRCKAQRPDLVAVAEEEEAYRPPPSSSLSALPPVSFRSGDGGDSEDDPAPLPLGSEAGTMRPSDPAPMSIYVVFIPAPGLLLLDVGVVFLYLEMALSLGGSGGALPPPGGGEKGYGGNLAQERRWWRRGDGSSDGSSDDGGSVGGGGALPPPDLEGGQAAGRESALGGSSGGSGVGFSRSGSGRR